VVCGLDVQIDTLPGGDDKLRARFEVWGEFLEVGTSEARDRLDLHPDHLGDAPFPSRFLPPHNRHPRPLFAI